MEHNKNKLQRGLSTRVTMWFESISYICWWLPFTPSCFHVIRWRHHMSLNAARNYLIQRCLPWLTSNKMCIVSDLKQTFRWNKALVLSWKDFWKSSEKQRVFSTSINVLSLSNTLHKKTMWWFYSAQRNTFLAIYAWHVASHYFYVKCSLK